MNDKKEDLQKKKVRVKARHERAINGFFILQTNNSPHGMLRSEKDIKRCATGQWQAVL